MTASFQPHPQKTDPEPPVEEYGDNHVTGLDEPEKDYPPPKDKAPDKPGEEPAEEQHDAGHGDIHPANEVWR
jgi:hypothetical protein